MDLFDFHIFSIAFFLIIPTLLQDAGDFSGQFSRLIGFNSAQPSVKLDKVAVSSKSWWCSTSEYNGFTFYRPHQFQVQVRSKCITTLSGFLHLYIGHEFTCVGIILIFCIVVPLYLFIKKIICIPLPFY